MRKKPVLNFNYRFNRYSDLLVGGPRAQHRDEGRVFVYVNNRKVRDNRFSIDLKSPRICCYLSLASQPTSHSVSQSASPTVSQSMISQPVSQLVSQLGPISKIPPSLIFSETSTTQLGDGLFINEQPYVEVFCRDSLSATDLR